MIPVQEIDIYTNKGKLFSVHLEKMRDDRYECKLSAIKLGNDISGDAVFGLFSIGGSSQEAFQKLLLSFKKSLSGFDEEDFISEIDNPCNTELITSEEQKLYLDREVDVKVNGVLNDI